MNLIKTLYFLLTAKDPHFLSVDLNTYNRWKYLIRISIKLNSNYKDCQIFRKKYKILENFVVVGLKFNGKNVKRRTAGYAREFVINHKKAKCLYCEKFLNQDNATADHIIPISNGGNNCQVNLIVCCKDCNSERGNLDFMSYLSRKNKKYSTEKKVFI